MRCILLLIVLLPAMFATPSIAAPDPVGYIAEGTCWQTPVYVIDTQVPGSTVVIVGGVHGDEPAGAAAAESILDWQFCRGRIIVIPRASVTALDGGTRLTPTAEGSDEMNLNRLFPKSVGDYPTHPLAKGIWQLLTLVRPDWVLDLHEGERYFIQEPPEREDKSVGQSIIIFRDTWSEPLARLMARAVNATIADPMEHSVLLSFGSTSRGQLSRAAHEHLGAEVMIVETVFSYEPLARRVREHQVMLTEFFRVLGMMEPGTNRTTIPVGETNIAN